MFDAGIDWSTHAVPSVMCTSIVLVLQVRKQAAEQLYVRLMTIEDEGTYAEHVLEQAYDVLTEVAWDGPVEVVRPARNRLLDVFDLKAADSSEASSDLQQLVLSSSKRRDENASYQALIDTGSRV